MEETKKFAFDVGVTFVASIITTILGFFLSILLARYLGPSDLGVYRIASTFYMIAMLLCAIGIPPALIKYLAEYSDDKSKINQFTSSGIITSLLLGLFFTVFFYFTSGLFAEIFKMPLLGDLIKILAFVFPFSLLNNVLFSFLNGLRMMKKYAVGIIIQNVAMFIITVFLIYYGWGVTGAILGTVLSSIILSIILIILCRNYFKLTFKSYKKTTNTLTRFGFQILSTNAVNEINNQMDIILVGMFLTAAAVGYYSLAVGLSIFFYIIPLSVQKITYPAISEYWRKNNRLAINKMMDKTMKYSTIILVFLGLLVGFFAKEIVIMLYGMDFIATVIPLQILLIGTVIRGSIAQPIGGSLMSIGRADLTFKITAFVMAINILLDIILIQSIGIIGAATATTVSLVLGAFLNLFFIVKHISINIDRKWFSSMLGVTILAILIFKLGSIYVNSIFIGLLLLISYLVVVFTIFITDEDKYIFKSLLSSTIHRR